MNEPQDPGTVVPPDQERPLAMAELCRLCEVHADLVIEMMTEGLLEPLPRSGAEAWLFPPWAAARVNTALRLQRDLGVNLAGAALALDLLDEVQALRRRLRALAARLEDAGR
ncbi:MAG TPA: chaperone modulator CbpM [Gammaproteobacteria bacterium]|nr:chaperone modulator CbpM [Gammaproteobacteria bacterium]